MTKPKPKPNQIQNNRDGNAADTAVTANVVEDANHSPSAKNQPRLTRKVSLLVDGTDLSASTRAWHHLHPLLTHHHIQTTIVSEEYEKKHLRQAAAAATSGKDAANKDKTHQNSVLVLHPWKETGFVIAPLTGGDVNRVVADVCSALETCAAHFGNDEMMPLAWSYANDYCKSLAAQDAVSLPASTLVMAPAEIVVTRRLANEACKDGTDLSLKANIYNLVHALADSSTCCDVVIACENKAHTNPDSPAVLSDRVWIKGTVADHAVRALTSIVQTQNGFGVGRNLDSEIEIETDATTVKASGSVAKSPTPHSRRAKRLGSVASTQPLTLRSDLGRQTGPTSFDQHFSSRDNASNTAAMSVSDADETIETSDDAVRGLRATSVKRRRSDSGGSSTTTGASSERAVKPRPKSRKGTATAKTVTSTPSSPMARKKRSSLSESRTKPNKSKTSFVADSKSNSSTKSFKSTFGKGKKSKKSTKSKSNPKPESAPNNKHNSKTKHNSKSSSKSKSAKGESRTKPPAAGYDFERAPESMINANAPVIAPTHQRRQVVGSVMALSTAQLTMVWHSSTIFHRGSR
jgi:hypothetical protein